MQNTIEMVVSLKVPDNTAITTLQTLNNMGFKIKDVKRSDYYKFDFEGDTEKFRESIKKVDALVNANKHIVNFGLENEGYAKVLVKNADDDGSGLLSLLSRLGFKNIKKAEKKTLWELKIEGEKSAARKIAEKAAKGLLVNRHYQEFEIK